MCANYRTASERMVTMNSGPLLHVSDFASALQ
jgi:hypothetical protein